MPRTVASLAAAASLRHEDLEQLKSLVRSRCLESHARATMSSPPPSSDAPTAELSAFVGAVQSQQTLEHATRLAVEQLLVAPAGSNRASHLHAQRSRESFQQRLHLDASPPPLDSSAATLRRIGEARAQGAAWHHELAQAAAAHAAAAGAVAAATGACRSPYASYLGADASSSAALPRAFGGPSARPLAPASPAPARPVELSPSVELSAAAAALALQHLHDLHAEMSLARADRAAALRARASAEEARAVGRAEGGAMGRVVGRATGRAEGRAAVEAMGRGRRRRRARRRRAWRRRRRRRRTWRRR